MAVSPVPFRKPRWLMTRARAIDAFVIWILSIALAGLFLLTGVPKVIGSGAVGFQASAMRDFPQVMRIIVGLVECLGAIGLLIPATASFAAIVLAVVMVPAALTQYASSGGMSGSRFLSSRSYS